MLKKLLSITLTAIMILGMGTSALASEIPSSNDSDIPRVNYLNDINVYKEFAFNSFTRDTTEPSTKWDWSKGAYTVSGSSSSGATLYTNYYFTDVVNRTFKFKAGSSNRISVDLVHKGLLIQTVVSTWTIDAGTTKTVKIASSDLDGKSETGNYYFRFNSNPKGNSYSVSGTFE